MVQTPDLTKFSTLVDLIRWQAAHNPQRSSFTYVPDGESKEEILTFEQLDQKARSLAATIQKRSAFGDRALVFYSSDWDFFIGIFGCLYAGVIPVLTNPPRPEASFAPLIKAVRDCGATLALTDDSFYSTIKNKVNETELAQLGWLVTDRLPADSAELEWRMPGITKETLALLVYTSGSTSDPKGVMITHGTFLDNIQPIADIYQFTPETVFISWAPLSHIGGITWPIINSGIGMKFVNFPTKAFMERPSRWFKLITKYRGTFALAFNFALQFCIDRIPQDEISGCDLSSWQSCLLGGERIRADLLERFTDRFAPIGFRPEIFDPGYGSTELVGGTGIDRPGVYKAYRLEQTAFEKNQVVIVDQDAQNFQIHVGCGLPIRGKRTLIVDPNTLKVLAPGQIGEIWVDSTHTAIGYWNKPEVNQQIFHAFTSDTHEGPFFRTGDLGGFVNHDLIVTGRLKDLIILQSKNFFSQDFEKTVEGSHPAIAPGGIAAVSITNQNEEQLAIICEIKPDLPHFDPEAVVKTVRNAVAREQQQSVSVVAFMKAGTIPRTASGKLQRFKVKEDLMAGRLETIWISNMENKLNGLEEKSGYVAPSTSIERAVVSIWESVLNIKQIGVTDSFFELGGDSIKGAQILSQIQEVFQVEIPTRSLFDRPTVKEMAHLVVETRQNKQKQQ